MIEIGKASIAAVLATCGLFGWRVTQLRLTFALKGRSKRVALPSQILLSLYGLRVRANPGNWLR